MEETFEGTFYFDNEKQDWFVHFVKPNKKEAIIKCNPKQISSNLPRNKDEKTQVKFETDKRYYTEVLNVRLLNEEITANEGNMATGDFHNPYNFVPAVPRKDITGELGDKPPCGHDLYISDKLSGKLTVKMTIETPLIVLDTARMSLNATDPKHKEFPVRIENEKPYINPTAVKGMLRSAYEAVTNSRLSVFTKHESRLAYRMDSTEGARIVPVRIEGEEGKEQFVFYTGTSQLKTANDKDGEPQNGNPLCAAWIETYNAGNCGLHNNRIKLKDVNRVPNNGEKVFAWIEKLSDGRNRFKFWNVGEMALDEASLIEAPPDNGNEHKKVFGFVCITGKNTGNGALSNMGNKHDERLFFNFYDGEAQPFYDSVDLTDDLRKSWNGLIKNYKIDKNEDNRPKVKKGGNDIKLQWSRHIRETHESEIQQNTELKAEKLKDGTLCYARVQWNGKTFDVIELYPVIISRRLHEVSPDSLLDASLKPAKLITQLSPADRVFGWVRQGKLKDNELSAEEKLVKEFGSYRGQVRFGEVQCKTENAIQDFNDLPLNILGQPKPQQGRFYVAENQDGNAQSSDEKRNNENAGYKAGRGLRGRKVYPHHDNLPDSYWITEEDWKAKENGGDLTQIGLEKDGKTYFREYLRPKGEKRFDSQNRSIKGWVKPNAEFEFNIHFTNLSEVELGALVWLLQLPENHFHRFGGGKPLGFGSIKLELKKYQISKGSELVEFYTSLDSELSESVKKDENRIEFEKTVEDSFIKPFTDEIEKLSEDIKAKYQNILKSFLRSYEGFTKTKLPIHYPRARRYKEDRDGNKTWITNNEELSSKPTLVPPHSEGLAYEWFVANNKMERGELKHAYALKNITQDDGLPILDHKKTGG